MNNVNAINKVDANFLGCEQSNIKMQLNPIKTQITNLDKFDCANIRKAFQYNSNISNMNIENIIDYIKNDLWYLINKVFKTKSELHFGTKNTSLLVPIEINLDGIVVLPLNKYGQELGYGSFKSAKLAVLVTDKINPLIVRSIQKLNTSVAKMCSDNELCILNKIKHYKQTHCTAIGLLTFYGSITYLKHPKIIEKKPIVDYDPQVFDISDEPNNEPVLKRAIFTKLYNYGNLRDYLKKCTFKNKIEVAYHIISGLNHLHFMDIFHSDIKKDNIFLNFVRGYPLEAVLGDYGFSCDLTEKKDRYYKNGNYDTMAPELLDKKRTGMPIDEKILACDIYAMGVVLRELFEGFSHPILDKLIGTMLDQDPQKRPTALEAKNQFKDFIRAKFTKPRS